ncbi:MAG: hypothetical protein GY847_14585 [Proteobacteria bacterium]|nr:hypothetical protein [Pseudomonadota bacterium]
MLSTEAVLLVMALAIAGCHHSSAPSANTDTDTDSDSDSGMDADTDSDSDMDTGSDDKYQWHTFYGASDCVLAGIGERGDCGNGITVGKSGEVYIAGSGPVIWSGPGGETSLNLCSESGCEFTMIKLSSSGTYKWHTFYATMELGKIAVDDEDSVYIVGSNSRWTGPGGEAPLNSYGNDMDSHVTVFKLDSVGAYKWHTFYGSGNDNARNIVVDKNGNVYVLGKSYKTWPGPGGEAPLNPHGGEDGDDNVFILKLNSSGAYKWHAFYGGSCDDKLHHCNYVNGITVDTNGNVYIAGNSKSSWTGPKGEASLNPHSNNKAEAAILKLDSSGAYKWHTFHAGGGGIAVDSGDNVYVVGTWSLSWIGPGGEAPLNPYTGGENGYNIMVLKLDSNGVYQWHTFYGKSDWGYDSYGRADVQVEEITVDGRNNIYVVGESKSSWTGPGGEAPLNPYTGRNYNIMAFKLDSRGAYKWHTFYGAGVLSYARDVVSDKGGNIFIVGESFETWTGPGGKPPLNAHAGCYDIVVIKVKD